MAGGYKFFFNLSRKGFYDDRALCNAGQAMASEGEMPALTQGRALLSFAVV
jgi:hypothetical protein